MMDSADFDNIVKEFKDWKTPNGSTRCFEDANSLDEHDRWLKQPQQHVFEDLMPIVKASYNFTCKFAKSKDYAYLNKEIRPQNCEPTLASYRAQMLALRTEAARTGQNYLSIQFFATHRVSCGGEHGVATNKIVYNTRNYELILVEEYLRTFSATTPNVYYFVIFANDCRADVSLSTA